MRPTPLLFSTVLACGVFLGTFAARLSPPASSKTTSFLLVSDAPLPLPREVTPTILTVSLSGELRNEDGEPISGAKVSLSSQQITESDHLGRFSFYGVAPGLLHVRVEHPDYFLYDAEPIQVVAGDDVKESLTLQRPRTVLLRFMNQKHQPLPEVELTAPEQPQIVTDLLGETKVKLPKWPGASVRVKASGFQPMLLALSSEESVEAILPRPASITGELLGAPANTELLLLPMEEGKLTSSPETIVVNQSIRVQGLLPGRYQVWLKGRGELWPLQEISLREGENRIKLNYLAPTIASAESCEEGFTPSSLIEHQDGVLVVQKSERELMAGDRIVAIDGVSLSGENSFAASWVGARGSIAHLTIERPAQKRFIFVSVPRNVAAVCNQ